MPESPGDGLGQTQPQLLILVKGYPRISESFIAQEFLGLEQAGVRFEIVSLRPPYDAIRHPVHDQITAPVRYLPEALRDAPRRVLAAAATVRKRPGFRRAFRLFLSDLRRDPSVLRARCFGQALVVAAEAPAGALWLHAHFAHSPAAVARYAAAILGTDFSISAHAKDIWTWPDWDLRAKLREARWTVTCTEVGRARLLEIAPGAPVHLCYHGLDLARFPPADREPSRRDGRDPDHPVRLLSVGRAVPKKGYDILLSALSRLPDGLHWRFEHIGDGTDLGRLKEQAERLGLASRITWRGKQDQQAVLDAYRTADLFVLASRSAGDLDRDGLPNVLVEAASQGLASVATDFSAIPELIEDGTSGLLVPTDDDRALSAALERAISDPDLRHRLGQAAERKVRTEFDFKPGIAQLKALFEAGWEDAS